MLLRGVRSAPRRHADRTGSGPAPSDRATEDVMPNLSMLVFVVFMLANCTSQPPPDSSIATTFAELRGQPAPRIYCDPWCDPSDPDPEVDATLRGAYSFAWSLYPGATWTGQGCIDLEPGTECLVRFSGPDFPCGPETVDCPNFPTHGRNRVHCHWLPSGGCD